MPSLRRDLQRFALRRFGLAVLTLLLVSIVLFAAAQVLPGDVGRTILGPYATPEQVMQLDHELGVDRPLPVRYWEWLTSFVQGDWGVSYVLNVPIRPLITERLVNSLILGGFALGLIIPLSIGLGVLAAMHYGKTLDRVISVAGLSVIALPEFVTGVILIVTFSIKLGWFPASSHVPSANPIDWFRQLLLPSIPVMFVLLGYISRMARAGTIDALRSNYARTAALKGLPRRRIMTHHILRNALTPTVTVISVQVGYLVGGLVVVETLFNYPGIGKLVLDSASNHDLLVLEATVLVIALLYMCSNMIADLTAAFLNPRIRLIA